MGGKLEGLGVQGGGEYRGKNWENCNSLINKIYFKKKSIGLIQEKENLPFGEVPEAETIVTDAR